ncbi:MAG: molybdopterin-binding protein [Pseudomonadota bacterium]
MPPSLSQSTPTDPKVESEAPTASFVVIGDEILSGRTKDKNIGFLADFLTGMGIDLVEVRIVSDTTEAIIEAVNALRVRTTYVFTSGGIGPTHDDITADAISAAFDVPCVHHPDAMAILAAHYEANGYEFTDARKRMARTPEGASLIANSVSKAPGFRIENVYVMAGVPKIMQAMMDAIAPTLAGGKQMLSVALDCPFGEGTIGGPLTTVQQDHPGTMIGSYPQHNDGSYTTQIVIRSRDEQAMEAAKKAVNAMLADLSGA